MFVEASSNRGNSIIRNHF